MDQRIGKLESKVEEVHTELKEQKEQLATTEYVLRTESQYIYQVVCDNHKEVIALFAGTQLENQQNKGVLQSHTEKFNKLRHALN